MDATWGYATALMRTVKRTVTEKIDGVMVTNEAGPDNSLVARTVAMVCSETRVTMNKKLGKGSETLGRDDYVPPDWRSYADPDGRHENHG
jgi:hypothetical protein